MGAAFMEICRSFESSLFDADLPSIRDFDDGPERHP
jgi:hypothetical protein